jgi:ABC-type bacteriocin/lantibiotic exporter with double-glycine peptidase domain
MQVAKATSYQQKVAEVLPTQQHTGWSCSAACLKAVLRHHGFEVPEILLIWLIGTRKGRGAETTEIVNAARKLGFEATEGSFPSLDAAAEVLRKGFPIICDVQSFKFLGKGHYVVLTGIEGDQVHLMDPNVSGNQRTISRQEMEERWWDREMAEPHKLMTRWGIIIRPRKRQ